MYNLYSLVFSLYPINMHLKFNLVFSLVHEQKKHNLKRHKWLMFGMFEIALVPQTYASIAINSTPNLWFNFMCCDIHHTLSRNVQFFLLTITFFSNLYEMVVCFTISLSLHNTHCQNSYSYIPCLHHYIKCCRLLCS